MRIKEKGRKMGKKFHFLGYLSSSRSMNFLYDHVEYVRKKEITRMRVRNISIPVTSVFLLYLVNINMSSMIKYIYKYIKSKKKLYAQEHVIG